MTTFTLDVLGEMCPEPILQTEAKYCQLNKGDILIIETDHSCATTFIPQRMKRYNCEISYKEVEWGVYQVKIVKKD